MSDSQVAPEGLRERGALLWVSLGQVRGTPAGELAVEACRIADRLDRLEEQLSGGPFVEFVCEDPDSDPSSFVLVVDKALAESRQQATALLGILGKVGLERAASEGPEEGSPLAKILALVQPAT